MASNPAIQRGLANLAQMFKPPDAGELVAYGRLNDMQRSRQAQSRLAEQFTDPYERALAEAVPPSDFIQHYGRHALARRGLNAAPGTNPRSFDTAAFTVFGNAGQTFEGIDTNNRAQAERNTQDRSADIVRTILTPTPQGAVRDVPQGVAAAVSRQFGINLEPGRSYGVQNNAPGTVSTDPNTNTVISRGDMRPQSPDQAFTGLIMGDLESGTIDRTTAQNRLRPPSLQIIQGPDGRPTYATPDQALGQPAAAAPQAPRDSRLAELQRERAAMQPGDPRIPQHDRAIRAAQQSSGFESTVDKGVGEVVVAEYKGALDGLRQGQEGLVSARSIRELATNPNTIQGAGADPRLFIQRIGALIGLDPSRVAVTEILQTLTNKQLLAESGGLGGQISNSDRDFIVSSGPNIGRDARTNVVLATIMETAAERRIARSQYALQLVRQNGGEAPRDLPQRMVEWDISNPPRNVVQEMFGPQRTQQTPGGAAPPQASAAPTAPDAQGMAEAAATGGGAQQPAASGPRIISRTPIQ